MTVVNKLNFDKDGLIPAVVQDRRTKRVLTLCYMNGEAVRRSMDEGKVYVYRRSRGRLMLKGETSKCVQIIKEVFVDCANNSLLFVVDQKRAGCHEGYFSCYYRKLDKSGSHKVIGKRVFNPKRVYGGGKR